MPDALPDENCPHCGKALSPDPDIGYRRDRIVHLVSHALGAALRLTLDDVADRSFWEVAEDCENDTWEDAAVAAHDQVLFVIDDVGGLTEHQQEKAETRALTWLKQHYPES